MLDNNISIKVITRSKSRFPLSQLSQGFKCRLCSMLFNHMDLDQILDIIFSFEFNIYSCSIDLLFDSVQFSSIAQSCPTLCEPMDCSTPGFPVHHQLPVYSNSRPLSQWCIQPSHPLSSPSPPTFNLYQHQGLFKWVSSSHQVAKVLRVSVSTSVLPMNIQDWFPLGWTGWISSQSKDLSRVFSNTTVQKHQFFGAQLFWLLFDYYSFKTYFDIWQSKSSLMTFFFS